VYNRQLIDLNVWLAKTAPGAAAPTAIIASTYADDTAEFSPDGKRIAFGSDRSNNFEAWVCDSDGANPVQLTFFGQGVNLSMRWSPDSRRVLVYSRIADRRQLYVVDAGGGSPDVIPGAGNSNADFSADGRWIYFAQPAEGNMVLAKAAAGGTHQVLKRFPLPGTAIRTSGDGRYLYFVRDGDLWRLPLNAEGDPAGEPLRVLGPLSASLNYAVVDGGVFFIARCAGASGLCISFLDFKTSQTRRVLAIQKPIWPALSATRDGNMVAWAQIDRNESDMMLVDGFR
jgi:dipeptidyl aminopeptidase/acylaminoacyl peptidase